MASDDGHEEWAVGEGKGYCIRRLQGQLQEVAPGGSQARTVIYLFKGQDSRGRPTGAQLDQGLLPYIDHMIQTLDFL